MESRTGRGILALICGALVAALAAVPAAAHDGALEGELEGGRQVFAAKFGTIEAPAVTAAAADPHPLTGEGENLELVANVPVDFGSDLELAGDYAFVGSYGEGMVVIDISDPENPQRAGLFDCPGGQNDIQLSPDTRYAVMAIETRNNECHPGDEGTVVLDVSDPTNPVEVAFIGSSELPEGSHNNTLDWPYLYVDQYIHTYSKLEVFDLSEPSDPQKVGELDYGGRDSIHDSLVEHREDGRDLLYAASINFTDVIDVTDPSRPELLQQIKDPQLTISHQAEPNHSNELLLVTDEYGGGSQVQACGGSGDARVPLPAGTAPPQVTDPASLGALHIYNLEENGRISGINGSGKAGIFNIPYQLNDDPFAGCTIHVFWQAPDENRLTTAWYGRGTRVVDFSDPADPKQLGYYIPEGADTWSAKPHNGYIFTGDIVRGFDVLRYTGEGWPADSGPAEAQRAEQQGVPLEDGSATPGQKGRDRAARAREGAGRP